MSKFYIGKIFPFLALIRIPYLCNAGHTASVYVFLIIDEELILKCGSEVKYCFYDPAGLAGRQDLNTLKFLQFQKMVIP